MAGLRISFILPDRFFGGGARAVLEHAVNLRRLGHHTVVYVPRNRSSALHHPLRALYREIRGYRDKRDFSWYAEDLPRMVPAIEDSFVEDGDFVVATWWETAFWVDRLGPSKGRKVHFIQSDERLLDPRAADAWQLPTAKITVAHWLQKRLAQLLQVRIHGPVMNAVNKTLFFQTPATSERERTVGVQFSTHELKGFSTAREAFRIVRAQRPETQFIAIGQRLLPRIPSFIRYYYKPRQEELRDIYSRCAVWLVPSKLDSMSLIPLEAASCGCALVATETGEVHRYFTPGKAFIQVVPGVVDGMAQALLDVTGDAAKREALALAAKEGIKNTTWEESSKEFERILNSLHSSR